MPKNVAVFGEMLADLFPQATVLGGAPFNVARHLHALGLNTLMLSKVGNDALGDAMRSTIQQLRMPTIGVQTDATYPTGQVMVNFAQNTHQFDILPNQAYDYIALDLAREALHQQAPSLFYFGSLALRNPDSYETAHALLQQVTCPRFLDINLRAPWFSAEKLALALHLADYLKVNDAELATLAQLFEFAQGDAVTLAKQFQTSFHLKQVIVTCGDQGAWMLDEAGTQLIAPACALKQPMIDTVGAGDAFSAVMMMGLLHEWDAQTSLNRANAMATAICTIRGAAPASNQFYAEFIKDWYLTLA